MCGYISKYSRTCLMLYSIYIYIYTYWLAADIIGMLVGIRVYVRLQYFMLCTISVQLNNTSCCVPFLYSSIALQYFILCTISVQLSCFTILHAVYHLQYCMLFTIYNTSSCVPFLYSSIALKSRGASHCFDYITQNGCLSYDLYLGEAKSTCTLKQGYGRI
jgi:hypothetical protein